MSCFSFQKMMMLHRKVAIHVIHVVHENPAAAFAQLHYVNSPYNLVFTMATHILFVLHFIVLPEQSTRQRKHYRTFEGQSQAYSWIHCWRGRSWRYRLRPTGMS